MDTYTIYIGDDLSDEDAFRVLNSSSLDGHGCHGLGIAVMEEDRETNASLKLRDPSEVADFLALLVGFGRERLVDTA